MADRGSPGIRRPAIDLERRTQLALNMTIEAVHQAMADDPPESAPAVGTSTPKAVDFLTSVSRLTLAKVIGEAALLLRAVAPIMDSNAGIRNSAEALIELAEPRARGMPLLTALCLEPAFALDRAYAHLIFRDLGYPDAAADRMLAAALSDNDPAVPERLSTFELEQDWLRGMWLGSSDGVQVPERSCLAQPLDALELSSNDIYSFTHSILYTTDVGRRPTHIPRPARDITADAEIALAAALDGDNYDLAAEALWIWPMLHEKWSASAILGLEVLIATQDQFGFLPGPGYDPEIPPSLSRDERHHYVLRTSYHTTLVMGILCAMSLRSRSHCSPHTNDHHEHLDATAKLLTQLLDDRPIPRWQRTTDRLPDPDKIGLAPFILTVALRRARSACNFGRVRELLAIAYRSDLLDIPTCRQAAGLLRRGTELAQLMAEGGRAATTRTNQLY